MKNKTAYFLILLPATILVCSAVGLFAGYKSRTWSVNARESYSASLTSEGVTIAVQPLFNNALAAQVFDKDDIVTRGIMPLAIAVFNDNDYEVEVDGMSIELIRGEDRIRTLVPSEAVSRLFGKSRSLLGKPSGRPLNEKALEDFDKKFLMSLSVPPRGKGGGFLYIPVYDSGNLATYLSTAMVYIPNVYRQDDGSRLIFFEIGLNAALPEGRGR